MDLGSGQLRAQQNKADLGSVAVGDHHERAGFDQIGNVPGSLYQGLILVGDGLVRLVPNQRVAPHGHYRNTVACA